jgi:hypothetical protein
MPAEDGRSDETPLFGPGGRIPTAPGITVTREPGITSLRRGWLPRHTATMTVLAPLVFLGYNAALGSALTDPLWIVLTATMSLTGALILTTYLPLRGARPAPGAPCSAMAGLLVPGVAILLTQATGLLSGGLALGLLGLGLWQRVSGIPTCG